MTTPLRARLVAVLPASIRIMARYVSLYSGLSPRNPEAIGPIDTSGKEDSCEWRPHLLTRHQPFAAVSDFLTKKKAVGGFTALKTVYPLGALTH